MEAHAARRAEGVPSTVPIHPLLFAAYPVVRLYEQSVSEVEPGDLVLPLLVVLGATALGMAVITLLMRDARRAAIVTSALLLPVLVFGLVREIVVASLFGASRNLDAFLTAFRAPNMLRDLFAEGALSTAFVTTFAKKIETEGDQSAWGPGPGHARNLGTGKGPGGRAPGERGGRPADAGQRRLPLQLLAPARRRPRGRRGSGHAGGPPRMR